jgi:hypothetical protein
MIRENTQVWSIAPGLCCDRHSLNGRGALGALRGMEVSGWKGVVNGRFSGEADEKDERRPR